ncbi:MULTISPECIES: nuclear transport factor 2 family protein [Sphingomonas]|uniref:Nuclear transport factor 2 family protein n=1 Tax=Sphingomonas lycopersici TaxID=2951807 RepID=A0AA41Z8T6_9SPHN|nr:MULTISPECIES: nuclear transport factor 2 family protein [Sphingomonas]MCW6530861.1 nuclear transport factor 2 family protein [Sphingomonas lycopersici]MCW6534897.1 nuclear transport factor 2 family protein [Sphingomonas lycopersici]OJU20427.1 MAG: polyketide cyclase [Sphingomonas sp. 66-10]
MTDPNTIAHNYLAVWNEADDAARADRLFAGWSNDARYVDPLMKGDGREGIAAMIAAARAQFPGHAFTLAGTPDGYGNYVRFSWTLAADGPAVAAGTDVVRLDEAGRIAEVVGFLDGTAA